MEHKLQNYELQIQSLQIEIDQAKSYSEKFQGELEIYKEKYSQSQDALTST